MRVILRNALSEYGRFAISIVVALFLSPFLVHTLGDTRYGIWSLVMSVSGYLLLLDLGIGSSLTRFVSKYNQIGDHPNLRGVVNSAVFLYGVIGLGIMLCSPLIGQIVLRFIKFDPALNDVVFWLVIIISFDAALLLLRAALRGTLYGLQRYDLVNLIFCSLAIFQPILFYIFLSNGFGLRSMGFILVVCNIVALILFDLIITKRYRFIRFHHKFIDRDNLKQIFGYSVFTFINMVANQVIYYSDAFVIGYFLSAAEITYYSIAWSLIEYLKRFSLSFAKVFVPVVSELEAVNDYERIRRVLNRASKYSLVMAMPLCVGVIFMGKPFVALWMGENYGRLCAPLMLVLIAPQFFELPQMISNSVLFGISKHKALSIAASASGAVNLILSIALVQIYGLIGVAIGTALPQILLCGVFTPLYTNRVIGQPIGRFFMATYAKVALPTICQALFLAWCVTYHYPNGYLLLLVQSAASTIFYLLLVYTVSLDSSERQAVAALIQKFASRAGLVRQGIQ